MGSETSLRNKIELLRREVSDHDIMEWGNLLRRDWLAVLTPYEFKIVNLIMDRTIGWKNKKREQISLTQFESGVVGEDGRVWSLGTNLPRRTITRCLKSLREKGFITVINLQTKDNGFECNFYSLNYIENHPKMLREPKKKKESGNRGLAISKRNTLGTSRPTPRDTQSLARDHQTYEERNPKEIKGKETNSRQSAAGVSGLVKEVQDRHKERKVTLRSNLLSSPKLTLYEIQKLWAMLFKEHYPDNSFFAWKKKEDIILHAYSKRFGVAVRGVPFGQYLDWVIKNWKMILATQMSWARNPPQFPVPVYLVKCSKHFEMAFANRQQLQAEASLSTRDRAIKKLTDRGMDYNTAVDEVDQKLGVSKQLQEMRDIEARVERDKLAIARAATAPLQRRRYQQPLVAASMPRVKIVDLPGSED